jgi:hypothetical protein
VWSLRQRGAFGSRALATTREADTRDALPLRGAHNTLSILDAELLCQIGIPLYVMLDRTREEQIEALNAGRLRIEDFRDVEARMLTELAMAKKGTGLPIAFAPFPLPDIVWALPEQAMRRVAPAFKDWQTLSEGHLQQRRAVNAKDFVAEALGIPKIHSGFIHDVIAVSAELRLSPHP